LKVLITVDTEIWPRIRDWPFSRQPTDRELRQAYESCVIGRTAVGDYGLPFLLDDLRRHDLKAVFFVESLSADAGAYDLLQDAVRLIQDAGQDVQLHAHTEWLSRERGPGLDARQFFTDYDLDEQRTIIRHARELLHHAGARRICAFRAGNMRADAATITAAADAGIGVEMSFLAGAMPKRNGTAVACTVLPVTCLRYRVSRTLRPAQLGSISGSELRSALLTHDAAGNDCFCVLLHSFELITLPPEGPPRPNRVNLARWRTLCDVLSSHRDTMPTIHADEIGCIERIEPAVVEGMHRHLPGRWAEQALSRLI
jgi:hypothetical protein